MASRVRKPAVKVAKEVTPTCPVDGEPVCIRHDRAILDILESMIDLYYGVGDTKECNAILAKIEELRK